MLSTTHGPDPSTASSAASSFAPHDGPRRASASSSSSSKSTLITAANAHSPAEQLLSSLLDVPLRITLKDGRAFVGHFICVDRFQNVILSQAEEFPPVPPAHSRVEETALSSSSTAPPPLTASTSSASSSATINNPSTQAIPPLTSSSPAEKEPWRDTESPITRGAWGGREIAMALCPGKEIVKVEAQISEEQHRVIVEGDDLYT